MRKHVVLGMVLLALTVSMAQAQAPNPNPQVTSAKAFYNYMKSNVLKTAEMVPEDKYSYR